MARFGLIGIQPESIPQGLGSLWDASRALIPPGKLKVLSFRALGEIPPIFPYSPLWGIGSYPLLSAAGAIRSDPSDLVAAPTAAAPAPGKLMVTSLV